jgi:hypothetical protein
MQSKSRTGVESSTFLLAQTRSGVDTAFSRCPSGALQTPCLPAFGYHDIPVLSRFEYLVQIGSLRLGSHERGILFTRHIEVAIHIAAAAELDLKLSPSRQVSDRSYAGWINWNSPHPKGLSLETAPYLMLRTDQHPPEKELQMEISWTMEFKAKAAGTKQKAPSSKGWGFDNMPAIT